MVDYDHEREFKPEFGIHGTSLKEKIDVERGRAWAYYINGGGGEPWNLYDGFPTLEALQHDRSR
jgi:hypothetical protein